MRRAYSCQSKHLYAKMLNQLKPEFFYKHPKLIMSLWYASQMGYFPNLRKPRDFHSQLMKINLDAYHNEERRSLRIQCADKYAVRQYVVDKGLGRLLNSCYGVYDSFDDIDFDVLPNQFVLKVTNGSGQNYICRDKTKMDYNSVRELFARWMAASKTFGLKTGEWHYSAIKPRIVAERYLSSLGEDKSIVDYKFHCIHGAVVGILVCYDRDNMLHEVNLDYYDVDWNLTDGILPQYHPNQRLIPKPESFNEMLSHVQCLCEGIEYVRVDMYEIDGQPYFGEMTFTPAGNVMLKYSAETLNNMLTVYLERC